MSGRFTPLTFAAIGGADSAAVGGEAGDALPDIAVAQAAHTPHSNAPNPEPNFV
jgi:hypothetical protein